MKGLVSVLVLTLAVYWGQCQGAHPTRTRQGLRPSSLASNLKLLEPALRALAGSDPKPARKPQPEQRGPVKSPAYTAIGGLPVSPGRELHLKSRPPTRTKKGRRPPHGKAGPPALMSGAGRKTAGRQRFTAKSQPEQPAIVPTYRTITSKAVHAEQESTEDVHVAPGVSASGVRQSFVQNRNVLVSHDEFTTNLAVTRQRTRQKRGMDRRYIKRHFTEMRVRPNANKDNITTIISVKADNAAMKRDSPVKGKPGTNNVTNVNENPNDKVVSAGYTYLPKPIITDMKPDRRIPTNIRNRGRFSDIPTGMQPQRHRSAFSRTQDMNKQKEFNHIRHDNTGTHKTAHNSHSATQRKGLSTSYIMKELLSRLWSKPYIEHSTVNNVSGEATAHNPMNQRSLSRYPPQFTPTKSQSKSTKRIFPSLYQSSVQTIPEPAPVIADSTRDQRLTLGSRLDLGQHDSSISTPNNKAIDSVQMRTGNKSLRTEKNRNTKKRRVGSRPNLSATANNTRATKFHSNSRRTWRYHVPHVRDIKQEAVGYEYTGNSSPNNAVSYSTSGKPNGKRNKPTFNGPPAIIKHKQLQGIVYPKITKPVQSLAVKLPVRSLATGDQLANNPNFMKSIQAYFLRNKAIRRTNNNAGNGMPADNRTGTTIMSSFPTEIGRNKSNGYKPITSAKANVAQSTRVVTDGPPTKYSVTTQDNAFARKANQTVELRSSSRSRKVTLANDKATYEELKSVVNAVRILQRYMNSETTSSILGMLSGKTTRSKKGADCKLCNILKLLVGLNCQMSVVS